MSARSHKLGLVGGAQRVGRHARRDRAEHLAAITDLDGGALDGEPQTLGELVAVRLVAADEHGELFAAVSCRDVGVAHHGAQRGPDTPERVVAGLVPVAIVEFLEVVEVEHDERELAAVAIALRDLMVEIVDEGAVVVEPREPVAERRGREQRLHLVVLALHPAQE